MIYFVLNSLHNEIKITLALLIRHFIKIANFLQYVLFKSSCKVTNHKKYLEPKLKPKIFWIFYNKNTII